MTPSRATRVLAVCSVIAVGALAAFSEPTAADTTVSCAALREWASPYATTRPTLDELAAFDRPHRIAIFNAVTPDVRAALWREQLTRVARRADLSETQRALITEGLRLTTPARYRGEPAVTAAFKAFWAEADDAFHTPEHRTAWYQLGTVSAAGDVWRDERPTNAAGGAWCNCKQGGSGDCFPGETCQSLPCSAHFGCGSTGGSQCNGICQ